MPQIKSLGYTIHIGSDSLKQLNSFLKKNNYSQYYILGDENTIQHCLPLLLSACKTLSKAEIFEVEAGEASKSLSICSQLWQTLLDYRADKNALMINLGGGVISDLGGFIASAYKRGIDFINIPTSLLGMVDASVGGKNGIDLGSVKNAVGTITQPKAVFVVPAFLETLPEEHLYNGLAEVYKIALVSDKSFWNKLGMGKISGLEETIRKSIELKNGIVKKDPAEKGQRKKLNFGHTVGHAIESASLGTKSELLHGEAVVIGMICEAWIAYQKKMISKNEMTEIIQVLSWRFALKKITKDQFDRAGEFLLNDKKSSKGQIFCALIEKIGSCKIHVKVSMDLVARSIDFYNSIV
jgi:3-dehydroquinate synthase